MIACAELWSLGPHSTAPAIPILDSQTHITMRCIVQLAGPPHDCAARTGETAVATDGQKSPSLMSKPTRARLVCLLSRRHSDRVGTFCRLDPEMAERAVDLVLEWEDVGRRGGTPTRYARREGVPVVIENKLQATRARIKLARLSASDPLVRECRAAVERQRAALR